MQSSLDIPRSILQGCTPRCFLSNTLHREITYSSYDQSSAGADITLLGTLSSSLIDGQRNNKDWTFNVAWTVLKCASRGVAESTLRISEKKGGMRRIL